MYSDSTLSDHSISPAVLEVAKDTVGKWSSTGADHDFDFPENEWGDGFTITSQMIESLPVEDVTDIIALSPGYVSGHFLGGGSGQVLYFLDGFPVFEPFENRLDTYIPLLALEKVDVNTTGIPVEYGNVLSGVVNMSTREGGASLSGSLRIRPDSNVSDGLRNPGNNITVDTHLGGPLFRYPVRWFIAGRLQKSPGLGTNPPDQLWAVNGNVSWKPTQKTKLRFFLNVHNQQYQTYSYRYSRSTYENEDSDGDGRLDRVIVMDSKDILDISFYEQGGILFGLTMTEALDLTGLDASRLEKRNVMLELDIDGAGNLLTGDNDFRNEDLNGNGVWDIVDLNRSASTTDSSYIDMNDDGQFQWGIDIPVPNTGNTDSLGHTVIKAYRTLTSDPVNGEFNDVFPMLDATPRNFMETLHLGLELNRLIGEKTHLRLLIGRYMSDYRYNTRETIEGPYILDYLRENNIPNDLIFSDRHRQNLLTDNNNNDFLDISEDAFPENPDMWLPWETVPSRNTLDIDRFYTYNAGATFHRQRWGEKKTVTWSAKSILSHRVTKSHQLEAGLEFKAYDLFDHEVGIPSSGNVYGQNIGSISGWGRPGEDFDDYGVDGVPESGDTGEGNGTWDHLDYGQDGVPALDGNSDGDYDDIFIDVPPDNGEGDGKVNYSEPAEPWNDFYPNHFRDATQQPLKPYHGAVFFMDRIFFGRFSILTQLRYDFFDSGVAGTGYKGVESSIEGIEEERTESTKREFWSPGLAISYYPGKNSRIYVRYSKQAQIPQFQQLFYNTNRYPSGAFPIVGNPFLSPLQSAGYEIGIRINRDSRSYIDISGFYRSDEELVGTDQQWVSSSNFRMSYSNSNKSIVKGYMMKIVGDLGPWVTCNLNYVYSRVKGKPASLDIVSDWSPLDTSEEWSYLDWDQRHMLNINVKVQMPVIGVDIFSTLRYGSGLPYTPPQSTMIPKINLERLPRTMMINLYAQKTISLPFPGSNSAVSIFLWVNNLLDAKNIISLADAEWYDMYKTVQSYYKSGDAVYFGSEDDTDGIDNDSDGYIDETITDEYMMIMDTDGDGEIDFNKKYLAGGKYGDPSFYSPDRTVRIGVSFKF